MKRAIKCKFEHVHMNFDSIYINVYSRTQMTLNVTIFKSLNDKIY